MSFLKFQIVGTAATGPSLQLAGATIKLDAGGVHHVEWPDADALGQQLLDLAACREPVVRFAGGALIADLPLQDNLTLECALRPAVRPQGLMADLERLFASAGCSLQRRSWHSTYPRQASPREQMQVRVGRALMAAPDVLIVDAHAWDDALLPRESFSQAFAAQYPWRALVWARTPAGNALPARSATVSASAP